MKRRILPLLATLLIFLSGVMAQVPQQMNYQAVVRDASGQPLASGTNITIRFQIHDGSMQGPVVFQETDQASTNQFGLVTVAIGSIGDLSIVAWGTGVKYLQVEVDPAGGNNFTDMGTTQMISVPFALFAANSANGPPGNTGPTGAAGTPGGTGATGATGAGGAQGVQGPTGNTGDVGPQGNTGPAGAVGAQGPAGPQGPVGNNGVQGIQGTAGAQGNTGAQGQQGFTGVTGATGPSGVDGTMGATGPSGGPVGPTGANGPTGPTGDAGPIGPSGTNGTDGNVGATGPAGPTGDVGPAGPIGSIGLTGPSGVDGTDGNAGATGANGATGSDGATGTTGNGISTAYIVNDSLYQVTTDGDTTNAGYVFGPTGAMGAPGNVGAVGATGATGNGISAAYIINDSLYQVTTDGDTTNAGYVFGPTGAMGATGNVGATGATGSTGNGISAAYIVNDSLYQVTTDGDTTNAGYVFGPTGAMGATGNVGATGATGSTGNGISMAYIVNDSLYQVTTDGDTTNAGYVFGPTGAMGATGNVGATGATGSTGNGISMAYIVNDSLYQVTTDGDTTNAGYVFGPTGAMGAPGNVGAVGATGSTGNGISTAYIVNDSLYQVTTDGDTTNAGYVFGPTGAMGAPGNVGAVGATGSTGNGISTTYVLNDSLYQVTTDGDTTNAGYVVGPTGATGNDGPTGPSGGPVGPSGADGAMGATGPTGPSGADGASGNDGAIGATGVAGPSGADGTAGATGATGPSGTGGPTYNAGTGITIDTSNDINSVWTEDSTTGNIYNNNIGNVGIGTTAPGTNLQINNANSNLQVLLSSVGESDMYITAVPGSSSNLFLDKPTLTDGNSLIFSSYNTGSYLWQIGTGGNNELQIVNYNNYAVNGVSTVLAISDSTGNIGIGTFAPTGMLHINQSLVGATTDLLDITNSGDANNLFISKTGFNNAAIISKSDTFSVSPTLLVQGNQASGSATMEVDAFNNTVAAFFGGSVSIVDGTQGANKVFTSDAFGNGSWQTLAGGGGATYNGGTGITIDGSNDINSVWTENSTTGNIFNNNHGNVGIGTLTPTAMFQIGDSAANNGSFRYIDGNQGEGEVLVSDANGNANWSGPIVFSVGTDQLVLEAAYDSPADQTVPYDVVVYDNTNSYSVLNSAFIAPITGYYHFDATVTWGDLTDFIGADGGLYEVDLLINGIAVHTSIITLADGSITAQSVSYDLLLGVGDQVSVGVVQINDAFGEEPISAQTSNTNFSGHLVR